MSQKNRILIIIIIVVIIILSFVVIRANNNNQKTNSVTRPISEIMLENNKNSKEKITNSTVENLGEVKSNLQNLFGKVGTDLINLDLYCTDFNLKVKFGSIKDVEILSRDELNESVDFFDNEGNKIDVSQNLYNEKGEAYIETKGIVQGIPVPKYAGNRVELINVFLESKVGNYYLIKYFVPFSEYTYYFISRLTDHGFRDFELYVISTGEFYYDDFYDYGIDSEIDILD